MNRDESILNIFSDEMAYWIGKAEEEKDMEQKTVLYGSVKYLIFLSSNPSSVTRDRLISDLNYYRTRAKTCVNTNREADELNRKMASMTVEAVIKLGKRIAELDKQG